MAHIKLHEVQSISNLTRALYFYLEWTAESSLKMNFKIWYHTNKVQPSMLSSKKIYNNVLFSLLSQFIFSILPMGLPYFPIHDPTIHDQKMHNSCITDVLLFKLCFTCYEYTDVEESSLHSIRNIKDFSA